MYKGRSKGDEIVQRERDDYKILMSEIKDVIVKKDLERCCQEIIAEEKETEVHANLTFISTLNYTLNIMHNADCNLTFNVTFNVAHNDTHNNGARII